MDFGDVIKKLKEDHTAKFTRFGWNGKGMFIMGEWPDEHSQMAQPFICIDIPGKGRCPWVASQADLLADDWTDHGSAFLLSLIEVDKRINEGANPKWFRRATWPENYSLFWSGPIKGRTTPEGRFCDEWSLADELAWDWVDVRANTEERTFGWVLEQVDNGEPFERFRRAGWPDVYNLCLKDGFLWLYTEDRVSHSLDPIDIWADDWEKIE